MPKAQNKAGENGNFGELDFGGLDSGELDFGGLDSGELDFGGLDSGVLDSSGLESASLDSKIKESIDYKTSDSDSASLESSAPNFAKNIKNAKYPISKIYGKAFENKQEFRQAFKPKRAKSAESKIIESKIAESKNDKSQIAESSPPESKIIKSKKLESTKTNRAKAESSFLDSSPLDSVAKESNPESSAESNPESKNARAQNTTNTTNTTNTPAKRRQNAYASRTLCAYIAALIKRHHFKHIALFYPLPHEPDILPLLKMLKKSKNKQIFLPTIRGLKFKMLPYRLPLIKNQLGIFEPSFSHLYWQKVDFALIPSLGIDRAFRRVGMGKGMYDRVFGARKPQPYKVFTSQNLNISTNIITQNFDIYAHEYVSYAFRARHRMTRGFNNVVNNSRVYRIWNRCRIERLSSL
ncbi:5-formyltetrahydrofolate cyclo-ligase [Helicobacter sp. CLO-3]|uniref:5-formyltetrahydrofolate cyclo-ligase n=1 Tax=Helicobacter sp. CLO-3 TaxID=211 RepID=UPI0008049FBD|nr:5-formyltetrahydrofolate cyclo-ligase [Helicobacter sp. CLO-3]OBV29021.1 5-formyltetrahydrofolate cyclo-ligase [Helicobacter sp. CLO-3]